MGFFSTIEAAIQQAEQTRQQSQSNIISAIGTAISQVSAQVEAEENEIKAKRQELLNAMIGCKEMMAKTPQSLADRKIELSKKQNSNDDEYITL
ncbi:Uncharacterised protein [Campylobacter devanensis]|uniref:Uncharacterized protein n=1 Tax=Campylobacter devanensis TaxID=3161138 RepID=A0A1X9SU49_9BACT|nr:hypothetical protein [Campylobacter lanienae]ARQ99715.1 hypothetical protein CIGN_1472 [Campylobacter lanienae]SUX02959.1 Uncharacterised protein [Campylobacter lanienae]